MMGLDIEKYSWTTGPEDAADLCKEAIGIHRAPLVTGTPHLGRGGAPLAADQGMGDIRSDGILLPALFDFLGFVYDTNDD